MELLAFTLPIALIFTAVVLLFYFGFPFFTTKFLESSQTRTRKLARTTDQVLLPSDVKNMARIYLFSPLILATLGFLLLPPKLRLAGVLLGIVLGFVFPNFYLRQIISRNRNKFANQLVDALMIMSSCFRGGLSLVQAMESVAEEMPDPIKQEFGTVLSENKMGVALEEALYHLYERIPSPALQQMVTAILLARETGGNLPAIFSRIVRTIREAKKIQENIKTLTLQGKIQGFVMSILPIAFFLFLNATNPRYVQVMINTEMGRSALMIAVVLEIIGVFMILKISSFKDV